MANTVLQLAVPRMECREILAARMDSDAVKGLTDVELGEETGLAELL